MTNQQPNGQTTSLTQNSRTRQITLIGLMTAITCILAPLSIPIGPVPISQRSSVCSLVWLYAISSEQSGSQN